jgi:hypothetical protein
MSDFPTKVKRQPIDLSAVTLAKPGQPEKMK